MKNQTVTRSWKVYGWYGHRQKVSFDPSFVDDFSKPGAARIIAVENADKTGTNDYTIVRITRNTAEECIEELFGQLYDGIFENVRFGEVEEIHAEPVSEKETDAEEILSGVIVEDLVESDQIALVDLLELSGKCGTLEEAAKNAAGRADAIISRKISFSSPDLLEKFSRQLLTDWDFLEGKGGSRTLDITPDQSASVKWFSIDCIGVYDGDDLVFVIDPQGYSYARYTFLPDRKTRYQSAEEYQEECRKEAEARASFSDIF